MSSKYSIGSGDSLPSIAEAYGHSGEWQALYAANPDVSPNDLRPGQELVIPDDWAPATSEGAATRAKSSSNRE